MISPEYMSVFEALADAIIVSDGSGSIRYANKATESLLGWPREQLLGKPITILMPQKVHAAHRRGIRRLVATGMPWNTGRPRRVTALRRDGTEVHVERAISLITIAPGERLIVAALKDIRDQLELDRQLGITRLIRATTGLSSKIAHQHDISLVVQATVDTVVSDFQAALARIWLRERDENVLVLKASGGLSQEVRRSLRARIDISAYPYKVGAVARARRPFLQNGLAGDPEFDQEWIQRERLQSAAVFPLLAYDVLVGVLAVFFRHPLDEEIFELLGTLAAVMASAAFHARLVAERERLMQEIHAERSRLQSLLMEAPFGIAILRGSNHVYELSNTVYNRILGKDPAGLSVEAAFPEIVAQGYDSVLDRVYEEKKTVALRGARLEIDEPGSGRRELFADLVNQPMRGDDGRVDGVLAFVFDVTDVVLSRRRPL
ncbi:MAG: PAS domain S-box protein [Deltaproteobacteria bacterium]|nr:PAS domain S-box protein [Deltaproteobacteria bacterium]